MAEVREGEIGWKIRQARRYNRPSLTQEALGKILGLSHSMVNRYENGSRVPPIETVERLSRELRIPLDWFYDNRPSPPPEVPIVNDARAPMSSPPGFNPASPKTGVPGVGRRLFPLVGLVGASIHPLEPGSGGPDDWVEFSDDLYRPERYAVRVRGDSMHPRLEHGDFVLVQPSIEIPRGLIAVARNGEYEYMVKTLTFADDSNRHVLRPINQEYPVVPVGDGWELVGYAVGLRRERGRGRYMEEGDDAGLRP